MKITMGALIITFILLLTAASVFATYLNEPTPPNDGFTVVSSERRVFGQSW